MTKVRISRAFESYLDGSHLFQCPTEIESHGYGDEGRALVEKVRATRRRKDGSRTIEVTDTQADILADYAEAMVEGAMDNVGLDTSALGEVNSGRAFLRALGR